MTQTYSGGCQCAKVRYEVQMDIGEVLACNCSRCGRLGSLLAFAPNDSIGTHPKSGAKMAAINVRCLDDVDVDSFKVQKVDGRSL